MPARKTVGEVALASAAKAGRVNEAASTKLKRALLMR
jgi:hypothetical protein